MASNATLDDLVLDINVSFDAAAVSRAGFGTVLIAGRNATFAERINFYTALAQVTDGTGLTTSSAEYYAAREAFAGGADRIAIGRMVASVSQVTTITVDTAADGDWVLTIDGTDFTFAASSDTANDIATGLRSAVNGGSVPVTASGSGADVVLTADVAGDGFTASIAVPGSGAASTVATTASVGVEDELTSIANENGDFYGVVLASRAQADILQAAAWTEANQRLFVAQSSDAGILTSGSTDVAALLSAASYERTALIYHGDDTEAADAAWLANRLSFDPDTNSTTFAHVTLAGVSVDTISVTSRTNVLGKNANVYLPLKSVGATYDGTCASGRYIDEVLTGDWFRSRIEEDHAQALLDASSRGEKIPHDGGGYAVFEAQVRTRWEQGARAGHFTREQAADGTDPLVLTIPTRQATPTADIRNRIFRYSGSALLAGAIHRVQFNVTATYG